MFVTKRQTLQDRAGNRWAVEFLQIYHMPVMHINQGWHLLDVCRNEEAALQRIEEFKFTLDTQCELRVRELNQYEEEEIP